MGMLQRGNKLDIDDQTPTQRRTNKKNHTRYVRRQLTPALLHEGLQELDGDDIDNADHELALYDAEYDIAYGPNEFADFDEYTELALDNAFIDEYYYDDMFV